MAQKLENRNEHSVKNRFFSLVSKFTSTPIRTLKKEKNYFKQEILEGVLNQNEKNYDLMKNNSESTEKTTDISENITNKNFIFEENLFKEEYENGKTFSLEENPFLFFDEEDGFLPSLSHF